MQLVSVVPYFRKVSVKDLDLHRSGAVCAPHKPMHLASSVDRRFGARRAGPCWRLFFAWALPGCGVLKGDVHDELSWKNLPQSSVSSGQQGTEQPGRGAGRVDARFSCLFILTRVQRVCAKAQLQM